MLYTGPRYLFLGWSAELRLIDGLLCHASADGQHGGGGGALTEGGQPIYPLQKVTHALRAYSPRSVGRIRSIAPMSEERTHLLSPDATARQLLSARRAKAVARITNSFDEQEEAIAKNLAEVHVVLECGDVHLKLVQNFANSMAFKVGTELNKIVLFKVPPSSLSFIPLPDLDGETRVGIRVTYGPNNSTFGPRHRQLPPCLQPLDYGRGELDYQTWVKVGQLSEAVDWIRGWKDESTRPRLTVQKIGKPSVPTNMLRCVNGLVCVNGITEVDEHTFATPTQRRDLKRLRQVPPAAASRC